MISRNFPRALFPQVSSCRRIQYNYSSISQANTEENAPRKRTQVQGWVRAVRKMKEYIFFDVSDGSTAEFVQVVVSKNNKPDNLSYGSSVSVVGELSQAPNGKTEVKAEDVRVIGSCDLESNDYPFMPRKQYSQDYIRQYLHLRPRTKQFASILRIRDLASSAIENHMRHRGFINIHTPIITSNDCEGAGEIFTVLPESSQLLQDMRKSKDQHTKSIYFDRNTYLTVSGQLHLEIMARALSKVYTFGPTFRAENSKSRLHLSEFYMIEAEMAFISDIKELMSEVEALVKAITSAVVEKGAADMNSVGTKPPDWLDKDFGIMTYDQAIDILEKHSDQLKIPIRHGTALTKEHELFLVNYNNGIPLFVINWPKEIKPFYMKECEDDPTKVAALDLLAPEVGEMFGGSLREDDYDKLKSRIPLEVDLSWYLELRKFGNVPTGGFGMGFERYLQAILGIGNIKDVIPFPRWPHNCSL